MAHSSAPALTNHLTDLSESAIAAILEERIKSGVYGPGARMPAERSLAAEFGVSRRFIRMALARLIDAGLMEKTHYRRPFVAFDGNIERISDVGSAHRANGSGGQSALQSIAAVLPSHPAFPGGLSMVAGVHKVLADAESPCRLTFLDTFHKDRSEVLRLEAKALGSLAKDSVSGLIWWYYSDEETVADFIRSHPRMPIVFVDRHPSDMGSDFVGIDDVDSSLSAVEYLFSLGHSRIAHLMDPGRYSTILEREEGYRQAHAARGIEVDEKLLVRLDWADDRMEAAFDALYSLAEPPTALFTTNDFIAHEFIKYAESRGVQVPGDLSVVGHGNIDRYAPRDFLTSVDQPFEAIGRAAAKLLLKRVSGTSGGRSAQHVILHAPLIVRESCRKLSAKEPLGARAAQAEAGNNAPGR